MKRPNPKDVNPYDSKAYKRTKEVIIKGLIPYVKKAFNIKVKIKSIKTRNPYK